MLSEKQKIIKLYGLNPFQSSFNFHSTLLRENDEPGDELPRHILFTFHIVKRKLSTSINVNIIMYTFDCLRMYNLDVIFKLLFFLWLQMTLLFSFYMIF